MQAKSNKIYELLQIFQISGMMNEPGAVKNGFQPTLVRHIPNVKPLITQKMEIKGNFHLLSHYRITILLYNSRQEEPRGIERWNRQTPSFHQKQSIDGSKIQ